MQTFSLLFFVITIIFLVIIIVTIFKILSLTREVAVLTKELADEQKEFSSLSQFNDKQTEIRNGRKAKVLEFLDKQAKISNNLVARKLGVSSATAFRYLDELEKEGKIKQNGKFGKLVFYSKIK